jgi:hypothetical protein
MSDTKNEVWIGPEDPTNFDPNVEFWFDPTAVSQTANVSVEELRLGGFVLKGREF